MGWKKVYQSPCIYHDGGLSSDW